MAAAKSVVVRVEPDIRAIDAAAWDACANPPGFSYNPFISHDFLASLEESGSVRAETGWLPQHLVLDDGKGGVAGALACYLKNHSQGEYVFDYGWADAYERAGGRYYPKLQASVPFTPATGRRLLVPPGPDAATRSTALINAGIELTGRLRASSLHLTFLPEDEWTMLGSMGLLQRTDQQCHWHNNGYATFDDFLGDLASRKRKAIRRERREAVAAGIDIEWVTGSDLTEGHWDAFFDFYMDTGSRKWGRPYLTRDFFSIVSSRMADRILLVMCKRAGRYIAGALNFIGGDTLFGRNWGGIEDHRFLHFEACYYQAIEFAIARGLDRVEAGAQGLEHKLARGYLPQTTHSAHYIADPGLREAVDRYLAQERRYVEQEGRALAENAPYRRGGAECG